MFPAPIELPLPENSLAGSRFSNLRGLRWRINLGILPCSFSASIEDLRRVAADSRRRYASLRRHLLIDPHVPKDGHRSPDLAQDNPLSQNPDSIWGRFFRNAELEKMVDQDLSRLYPEHGSYFQTPACQAMLRRILLLWCLRHPEHGYRQGMHELLAPLLYVLHVDLQYLSQIQELYKDYFKDEFDENSFPERDLRGFTKATNNKIEDKKNSFHVTTPKIGGLDELDSETRDIFLVSDPYGAEGELGVILSERFTEHDAYCMFDNLMSGAGGVVAMADFYFPSPILGSNTGVPPVIEASSALYHLLSIVDSSLHSHLVELGVEPQYFALRWLRVLFGREFSLDDLLLIWDELFSSSNNTSIEDIADYSFRILCSHRGAFISAMAVSMLLHVRSSLFATENATSCLQRLLNFPRSINVKKMIEKAKSLRALALDSNSLSSPSPRSVVPNKAASRVRSMSIGSVSVSPKTPLYPVPDSYWEEKWRVLHKDEAIERGIRREKVSGGILKGPMMERLHLSRTESDPSPAKSTSGEKNTLSSLRRNLIDDLSRGIDSDAAIVKSEEGPGDPTISGRISDCVVEEACLSGDNSSVFSTTTSPISIHNEEENASEKSSVTSDSFVGENDEEANQESEVQEPEVQEPPKADTAIVESRPSKQESVSKERKPASGKFQWFWKFGRGSGEGSSDAQRFSIAGNVLKNNGGASFKTLGQSMLDNIKVIESTLGENRGGDLRGKGQDVAPSAAAALKELRRISNLLSEMRGE